MKPKIEKTSVHWLIHGRVQGVSFRAFTRKSALELGLGGWVRNLADGQVEVFAQGSREALDRFREAASSGPFLARVDHLQELNPVESVAIEETPMTGFEIRPSASAPESMTHEVDRQWKNQSGT